MALLLIPFVVGLVSSPQEQFEKTKHPWLKWKVGAYAKFRTTMSGKDGTITLKLIKIVETGYTLSKESHMFGMTQLKEDAITIPQNVGVETLVIDGQRLECAVWAQKGTEGGEAIERKVWVPKAKDFAVKIETTGGDELKLEAKKLKEEIGIESKKYVCVRLEGTRRVPSGRVKMVGWQNAEVVGGLVKLEQFEPGGALRAFTMELEESGDGDSSTLDVELAELEPSEIKAEHFLQFKKGTLWIYEGPLLEMTVTVTRVEEGKITLEWVSKGTSADDKTLRVETREWQVRDGCLIQRDVGSEIAEVIYKAGSREGGQWTFRGEGEDKHVQVRNLGQVELKVGAGAYKKATKIRVLWDEDSGNRTLYYLVPGVGIVQMERLIDGCALHLSKFIPAR